MQLSFVSVRFLPGVPIFAVYHPGWVGREMYRPGRGHRWGRHRRRWPGAGSAIIGVSDTGSAIIGSSSGGSAVIGGVGDSGMSSAECRHEERCHS